MSYLIEHVRRRPQPHAEQPTAWERLEASANALRPLWWEHSRPHPKLDVGIFRIADPISVTKNIEMVSLQYEKWINELRETGIDVSSLAGEYDMFRRYAKRHNAKPYVRIADLHIPPRQELRTLPDDVRRSAAQLAGWLEAYNFYHPETPIGFLRGRTALSIHKRAANLGFERIWPDKTAWSHDRRDLIEHLVQNPHLTAEQLAKHAISMVLTSRKAFARAQGVVRRHSAITTRNGHTLILPHKGNGVQLQLIDSAGNTSMSDHDAQVFRGAIQLALAVAHDAKCDITIRIPDTAPFHPHLNRAKRSDGPWSLHEQMGAPVRSYGMPPPDIIEAFMMP